MDFPDLAAILPRAVRDRIAPMLRGGSRNIVLAGAVLAVAVALVAVLWSWNSSYAVLYAGLSAAEGGQAISDLQKLNIAYRTAEGGRVILVPSDELGRARLELALRGVPKRGGDQWALLDNESLGASPFVEQVHYTRAIEGVLSRTVGQIDGVVAATVKLALPKNTDFLGDEPKPSASVMVRLMPGVELAAAQVDGIAGLVAASVPGLTRDHVTIVDQSGKVLSRDMQSGLQQVPQQLAVARDIERRYEQAVSELLAPVLGPGNFRVSVDADIDFSHAKESSIRYGGGHILSQDETIHPVGSAGDAPIGIPGALSNKPPPVPSIVPNPGTAAAQSAPPESGATPPKPAPPPQDTHRTTNFDIDHTVQYRDQPFWSVRAIDVAVLVNQPAKKPLGADMIGSIKTLVASAVAIGETRHIAVVDLPFEGLPDAAVTGPAGWWTAPWVAAVAQNAMLALGGLALMFGGLGPLRRRLDAGHLAMRPHGGAGSVAGAAATAPGREPRIPPRVVAGTAFQPQPVDADPETVRNLVISEPDRTAQVIKEWIARDRNRLKQAG